MDNLNLKILGVIGLRSAGLALALLGRVKESDALYALADAAEAGANIDAHMAEVAAKLKDKGVTEADWQDVTDRINADSARLQGS